MDIIGLFFPTQNRANCLNHYIVYYLIVGKKMSLTSDIENKKN